MAEETKNPMDLNGDGKVTVGEKVQYYAGKAKEVGAKAKEKAKEVYAEAKEDAKELKEKAKAKVDEIKAKKSA